MRACLRAFQFTHPVRGATGSVIAAQTTIDSFNSRTPCGVRLIYRSSISDALSVSIHAPRAGCDPETYPLQANQPRFQFTHPVRGATPRPTRSKQTNQGFNSRTPCGVRQLRADDPELFAQFQFTHPVRGATFSLTAWLSGSASFQFTHPVRGATQIELFSIVI